MYLQQVDPWLGYQWGRSLTQRELPRARRRLRRRRQARRHPPARRRHQDDGPQPHQLLRHLPQHPLPRRRRRHDHRQERRRRPQHAAHVRRRPGRDDRPADAPAGAGHRRHQPRRLDQLRGDEGQALRHPQPARRRRRRRASPSTTAASTTTTATAIPTSTRSSNPIFVDKDGKRIAFARNLKFPGVAGYTFEVQVFGFGHLYMPFRPPVSTTLRAFTPTPFDIHSRPAGATTRRRYTSPNGDGFALVSNAGAQQFVTAAGKDRGARPTGPPGISLDDPDRDGYCEEITEGDLDVAEWYLLNHPAPGARPDHRRRPARREAVPADRLRRPATSPTGTCTPPTRRPRTTPSASTATAASSTCRSPTTTRPSGWKASCVYLADKKGEQRWCRSAAAYTVRGIYSDFKYHDVGEAFYQMQFDGSVVTQVADHAAVGRRPAPPPTATTAPASTSTTSSAATAARRWTRARPTPRLTDTERTAGRSPSCESLVLYQTDQLPVRHQRRRQDRRALHGARAWTPASSASTPNGCSRSPARSKARSANVRGEKIISLRADQRARRPTGSTWST